MNLLVLSLILQRLIYTRSSTAVCSDFGTDKEIGPWIALPGDDNDVSKSKPVRAIDDHILLAPDFQFNQHCAHAFFDAGVTETPAGPGKNAGRIALPISGAHVLRVLPESVTSFSYIGVWCETENRSLAYVRIPSGFKPATSVKLGDFQEVSHGVSGTVTLLDAKTFEVEQFSYFGDGNATFMVGDSDEPNKRENNNTIEQLPMQVSDSDKNYGPIPASVGVNLRLKIPPNRSICRLKWLSLYDGGLKQSFGHVRISVDVEVPIDRDQNRPYWTTTTANPSSETMTTESSETSPTSPGTTSTSRPTPITSRRTTTASMKPRTTSSFGSRPEYDTMVVIVAIILFVDVLHTTQSLF